MKPIFSKLVVLALFLFAFSSAQGQGIIKVNPIGLAFGSLNVGYEGVVSDKSSYYIGANIISRKLLGIRYNGFGVGGQYRFYLSQKEAPEGLWAGPAVNINFVNFDDGFSSDNFNYTLIQIGGIIGYQWIFSEKFTVELGLGPSYGIITSDDIGDDAFGEGIVPIGILSLGYMFGG